MDPARQDARSAPPAIRGRSRSDPACAARFLRKRAAARRPTKFCERDRLLGATEGPSHSCRGKPIVECSRGFSEFGCLHVTTAALGEQVQAGGQQSVGTIRSNLELRRHVRVGSGIFRTFRAALIGAFILGYGSRVRLSWCDHYLRNERFNCDPNPIGP